jgi:hypothetical protein
MMIVHAECCRGVADDVDAHLIVGEWVGWNWAYWKGIVLRFIRSGVT